MDDNKNITAAQPLDLDKLEALARAATPQNFDSAQIKNQGFIECPSCDGSGEVELTADYCNYDGKAMGVQFYGVGPEHRAAEAFFRAANPATVIALISLARRAAADAPAADERAQATLDKICDLFHIGALARDESTILANVQNVLRRSECLSAVEREFFMVAAEPDDDFPGDEPGEECLLNWGADPVEYVEQFRAARAAHPIGQVSPAIDQVADAKATAESIDEIIERLPNSRLGSRCPMCGVDHPHTHTPREITIFRNGAKYAARQQEYARADHQGAAQDEVHDTGGTGAGGRAGAHEHHEHRARQSDADGRDGVEDGGSAGVSDRGQVREAVAAPVCHAPAGWREFLEEITQSGKDMNGAYWIPRAAKLLESAASPAAAPDAAHADDPFGPQRWSKEAEMMESWAAHADAKATQTAPNEPQSAHAQQDAAPAAIVKRNETGVDAVFVGEGANLPHGTQLYADPIAVSPSDATGKADAASAGEQAAEFHSKFGSPELCAAIVAHATSAADAMDAELADVLNTTLWLYRRLPQAYGNPPFVDKAIMTMAERLGLDDVPDAIKERAAMAASRNGEIK
jgi:hypothetical protein